MLKAIIPLSIAGIGAGGYVYNKDEGVQRSVKFWSRAFPVFLHYRSIQLLNRDLKIMPDEKADKIYEELHEFYAPFVRDLTYDMKGFYLKQAQLLSTQDDIFPAPYMKWMKDTQDRVPTQFLPGEAKEYCRSLLKSEQNLDFDQVFSEWIDEPIGIASIGQVHKAKLRKNNQWVAVKILIPNIEKKFYNDVKTIRNFCALAMPQHVGVFKELERNFSVEFNYYKEGEVQNLFNKQLEIFSDKIRVPYSYLEYSSKNLLVMEYLEGVKLIDGIKEGIVEVAKSTGKTVEEIEQMHRDDILKNGFKSLDESLRSNQKFEYQLLLHDLLKPSNIKKMLYNATPYAWFYGGISPLEYTKKPVNLAEIIKIISDSSAYQLFTIGTFNGDPHPGNILLLKDGRVGLIDFGQVKSMTEYDRYLYAKMLLAHYKYDKDEVADIYFNKTRTKTKYSKRDIAYLYSSFYFDRDTDDVTNGMSIPTFIDWLQDQDPILSIDEEFITIGRVNLMIRGLGKAFGMKLRMSELWKESAENYIEYYKQNHPKDF